MTNSEVKDWLSRGRVVNETVNSLKQAREEALARVVDITNTYGFTKISRGGKQRHDDALVKYANEDYDGTLLSWIDELHATLCEIARAIHTVSERLECLVLINRYILFKTWEQLAEDMEMSTQWAHKLHHRALDAVKDYLATSADFDRE